MIKKYLVFGVSALRVFVANSYVCEPNLSFYYRRKREQVFWTRQNIPAAVDEPEIGGRCVNWFLSLEQPQKKKIGIL